MQMIVCPKCGAENYTSSRTNLPPCHNCGYDFKSHSTEDENAETPCLPSGREDSKEEPH